MNLTVIRQSTLQFRLSTLLLSTALAALAFGWAVDRYVNHVRPCNEQLALHRRLSARFAVVDRLHQFNDSPNLHVKRIKDILFSAYMNLFEDSKLLSRSVGTSADTRADFDTLHSLGGRTLVRLKIASLSDFKERLAASGIGKVHGYDLYTPDGELRPDLVHFVKESLERVNDDRPVAGYGG